MESRTITANSLVTMLLMTIATQAAFSQSTGLLKGKLSDRNGDGIDYAHVVVTKESERHEFTVDKDGNYSVALPEGEYTVTGQARGFRPSEARKVNIRAGQETQLNDVLFGNMDNSVCWLDLQTAKEEKLATVDIDVKIVRLESAGKHKSQTRKRKAKEKKPRVQ